MRTWAKICVSGNLGSRNCLVGTRCSIFFKRTFSYSTISLCISDNTISLDKWSKTDNWSCRKNSYKMFLICLMHFRVLERVLCYHYGVNPSLNSHLNSYLCNINICFNHTYALNIEDVTGWSSFMTNLRLVALVLTKIPKCTNYNKLL